MSSSILCSLYPETREVKTELNKVGEAHARTLIKAGKVNRGAWSFAAEEKSKLLGSEGKDFAAYGKWHLGMTQELPKTLASTIGTPSARTARCTSKRCGPSAPDPRQQKAQGVFAAAGSLLDLAEPKKGASERLLLPPGYERRSYPGEIRLATDTETGQPIVQGYASVYGTLSEDLGGFRERVNPGCFRDCLESGKDVRAFFNHEPTQIVARRSGESETHR